MQQPQHLVTAVLLKTIALSPDRRCVVPSNFLVAEAVGPGSNHTRVTEELDRDETSWVVGSHRAQNNEGLRFGDSRETQLIIHADRSWSDVERVEWLVGDPVLLELDQASAGLKHLEAIKSWDAQLQVRLVHPLEVLIASENNDFVIDGPVGFGTFKALNGVVQCSVCRRNAEWLIGHNFWSLPPAIAHVVVDFKHMVGRQSSKGILMVRPWLLFQLLTLSNLEILGQESLLHCSERATLAHGSKNHSLSALLSVEECSSAPRLQQSYKWCQWHMLAAYN